MLSHASAEFELGIEYRAPPTALHRNPIFREGTRPKTGASLSPKGEIEKWSYEMDVTNVPATLRHGPPMQYLPDLDGNHHKPPVLPSPF